MKTKFTKGPWKNIKNSWAESSVMADYGETICESDISNVCDEETQDAFEKLQRANMALIAAAPLMHLLLALRSASGDNDALELTEAISDGNEQAMRNLWERLQAEAQEKQIL